ncbi:MAG: TlpA disulfide reductase family protein, partial [Bacteroidales bacterium]|nr:TlpA disulfide reductase family protein [Bacteroidales bacterium]
AYIGYPMWIHKNWYGSFTGKIDQKVENPIVFQSIDGKILPLSDFNCKYLVLDFWKSTCGYCFDAFPKVQKQYEELKANKDIELYSVFCMIKERNETSKIGDELLQKRGYTFPRLAIDVKDPVLKEIEVTAFPNVIIITPSGNIVFRGNIESAIKFIRKLK